MNMQGKSEVYKMAEDRLVTNKYDLDAWSILIKDHQSRRGMDEESRPFFERLVETFPLTGRFWKIYIEQEMKSKNYEKVEKLFGRCLTKVLNIDLWKCYLHYIKETKSSNANFREKMSRAYEFALDNIGLDYNSFSIWFEYINFLKNVDAVGSYAENQKITATRKIYQRGIVNPMINIEAFWKDYVEYEKSINHHIAEKMTQDRSKDYMKARAVAKELEAITRGLNKSAPSLPPTSVPSMDEVRQVELWRKWINWEKSNPMKFEDDCERIKRVVFVFEQSLLVLAHYPDVWYEYSLYLESIAKNVAEKGSDPKKYLDDAATIYDRAINSVLKDNVLLHFAAADFEENRNRRSKCTEIYDKILKVEHVDPTLIYVQYMRFARRTEGMKAVRNIFKRAREDPRTGFRAYIASALMEFYCQKEVTVACKIFELALKKFPNEVNLVTTYSDFLSSLNEPNNVRVLFEKVLTQSMQGMGEVLSPESSLVVWNKFLEFEANVGDLASIGKVELRRSIAIDRVFGTSDTSTNYKANGMNGTNVSSGTKVGVTDTALLVDRYKFIDLFPCSIQELRAINYDKLIATVTKGADLSPVTIAAVSAVGGGKVSFRNDDTSSSDGTKDGKSQKKDSSSSRNNSKPDIRQMIPFKPVPNYSHHLLGSHTIPGGMFPPPPSVSTLLSLLPPPMSFRGPFVDIDHLMHAIVNRGVMKPRAEGLGSNGLRLFDAAMSARQGGDSNNVDSKAGIKRMHVDDEDDEGSNQGPVGLGPDIYRARKIKSSGTGNKIGLKS